MGLSEFIPADWRAVLADAISDPDFAALETFIEEQREVDVYPPREQIFEAFRLTPLASVRAVIVGQDPYPTKGRAHGLAFSVPPGMKRPPSLQNILSELAQDEGVPVPEGGSLVHWAEHGVLLLNTVLTVRAGKAGSHAGHGWEPFTDAVIKAVAAQPRPIAFLLWGRRAQRKAALISDPPHVLITAAHPSPLSAKRGFLDSHPFSRANQALVERGQPPIDWNLVSRSA